MHKSKSTGIPVGTKGFILPKSAQICDVKDFGEEFHADVDVYQPDPFVGVPTEGPMAICVHTCKRCGNVTESIGTGYIKYYCSNCAASNRGEVEMTRTFELLEDG